MAISYVDGINANVDISINSNSYKAIFGYWTGVIDRQLNEISTFAGSGWRQFLAGIKSFSGRCEGYLAQKVVMSDPSLFFAADAAVPLVLTADTGCTFTFSGFVSTSGVGVRAQGPADFGVAFRASGVVTTAWVTT